MKKAFTLIELLVVVSIIGVLAVALVPTIGSAPAKARDAARKTKVGEVIKAVEMYNIDKGGYLQVADGSDTMCAMQDGAVAPAFTEYIADFELSGNPTAALCDNGIGYTPLAGGGYWVYVSVENESSGKHCGINAADGVPVDVPCGDNVTTYTYAVKR